MDLDEIVGDREEGRVGDDSYFDNLLLNLCLKENGMGLGSALLEMMRQRDGGTYELRSPFSSEAVSSRGEVLDSLSLETGDQAVQRRSSDTFSVLTNPGHEVKGS